MLRLALWPVALATAAGTATLILTGGLADSPGLTATIGVVVGLAWWLIGLEQWRRMPGRRIGPLMVGLGFAWFAGLLVHAPVSLLYTVGLFCRALFIALLGHLLLAFPRDRLEGRPARAIAVAAYVDTLLVNGVSVLFTDPGSPDYRNLALVEPDPVLARTFQDTARGIGVALLIATLVVVADRWRRATPPWRRAVGPVLWLAAAAAALAALRLLNKALGGPLGPVEPIFFVVLATVPLAFEVGLLRSRLDRGAVADLVVQLGQPGAPGQLRDALARALHDPHLTLAYWLPQQERFVDLDGLPVELPRDDGSGLTATLVVHEGRTVAALIHDVSLRQDPELVQGVSAAAGMALANERLQAELRANLDELKASRIRIVEAADAERRRVERDLHDGTQQRLLSISMALGLAESKLDSDPEAARRVVREARTSLSTALQELRELSQGIHPGILTERGLGPALHELAYAAPVPVDIEIPAGIRLPEPLEAGVYFVVAEALANVAKHASAGAASVRVTRRDGHVVVEVRDDGVGGADPARGSGLRGLADRVEALGGTLVVASTPAEGTRLTAEIPCAS
jgi:signal transduction histidine kinase